MIKVSVDHSSEIMQAKNKWHVIFTALNGISTEWKQKKKQKNTLLTQNSVISENIIQE